MKTPEEMAEYFRSMPKKKVEENSYWIFDEESISIRSTLHTVTPGAGTKPFSLEESKPVLRAVREFFRRYYESFCSEAQVLCVTDEDADKLANLGIPVLASGHIWPFDVTVVVLPQDNSAGTSRISEWFWQNRIISAGIRPVARIHSHYVLDPYQSITDYSTLNSGTLEMVIGRIDKEELHVCYWLDVPGTDIKSQTFVATEDEFGRFTQVPHRFHSQTESEDSECQLCEDTEDNDAAVMAAK